MELKLIWRLPAKFDNDIKLSLLYTGGASPQQIDDIEMLSDVLHDLDLFHQVQQLRFVHRWLDHFDCHRGLILVSQDAHGLGFDHPTEGSGADFIPKLEPENKNSHYLHIQLLGRT